MITPALRLSTGMCSITCATVKPAKAGAVAMRSTPATRVPVTCTDFHAYFIALCRAVNIPARFAIGFTIPANKNAGVIGGYHCWAEFHANGKWVPVDISEADKHPELADYCLWHHPANRLEPSRGRDITVKPAPKAGPFNYFFGHPRGERQGSPRESHFRIQTPAGKMKPGSTFH